MPASPKAKNFHVRCIPTNLSEQSRHKVYRHYKYNSTLTIRYVFEEKHEAKIDTSDIHVECGGHIGSGPGTGASADPGGILIDCQ